MKMKCDQNEGTWFERWRKKRAIKKYVKNLGPELVRTVGKKRYYTPAEVKRTAQAGNYPMDYICYGIATYSSPTDFHNYHANRGENCDYEAMRTEIGDVCFRGNSDFTIVDVIGASSSGSFFSDLFSGDWGGGDSSDPGGGDFSCSSDGGGD